MKREKVAAARRAIAERRQAAGSADVTQADVDVAADVLVVERIRPHPRILLPITGGSLSTVTPLLEDWFARFALRSVDPNSPNLDVPTRVALHLRLLVAQLAATVREQVRGVADPTQALIAAAQVGEHQALRAQVAALTAERDKLSQQLAALTYRVAELQSQLQARMGTHEEQVKQLQRATEHLGSTLAQAHALLQQPTAPPESALVALTTQVRRLSTALARRQPATRSAPKRPNGGKRAQRTETRRNPLPKKQKARRKRRRIAARTR